MNPASRLNPASFSQPPARSTGLILPRALLALFGLTLRQYLHGRRWMIMAVLFLLPAGLAVIIRATGGEVPGIALEFLLAFFFIPQALLPLVALVYASGMLQDEEEEQTITYLLIRPIPKWAMYGTKLAATLVMASLLTAVFTATTYAAIYAGLEHRPDNIAIRCLKALSLHVFAVVAYCCLFGAMSLYTRRTLIAGIIYAAIFEGLLGNLPFSIRLITVIYYARLLAYRWMAFIIPTPFGSHDIAADAWQLDTQLDPKLLEHPQTRTCVIVLIAASVVFGLIAAFLCSRKEFHVKTPEKG